MILDYVLKFYLQECLNILCEQDCKGFYSLNIDFMKLFETHPDIGDQVLCSPVETISLCDKDLLKAQQTILEGDEYKTQVEKLGYSSLKRNVHARFFSLPVCPELHRTIFPKNVDLGCFLKLTGTVVRVTQAKMLEFYRSYICVKCKYENTLQGDFEHRYILKAPTKCANEETRCKSTNFTPVNLVSRDHCKDYQEIKIQEQVNKLSIGTIPGSMWVVLEDDLVDSCKPGDDVNICGTVRRRWRPATANKKSEVELVLQANYLEVCNAQRSTIIATAPDIKDCFDEYWAKFEGCPLKGRDRILASVCPQVYGLHLVKLALLLTVITGSNHIVENEAEKKCSQDEKQTRVRGQCHLLLVGDPGTGKSQLLRAGADLTPRSVFTSGAGSTRAGLTCSALREDGEWQLEAGALVLSDGGVCCIDEIGQLREHDRTSIHEAMEQQTISIAKAGIVCKLNTRCAVIAACNPKGHYQTEEPLSVNVSLGTPLLSRFDLIFILLDSKNKAWDKLVSSYILFGGSNATDSKKQWSLEKLQMYIGLVGPRYTEMTKSANIILQTYYMAQRKSNYRDPSRTTVRMLDSLVRLSQAHCRLMYRTMILPVDAIVAVSLIDLSMQDCTLNDTVDALHSTFPKYPDFDYLCTAKKLLAKLGLQKIWKEELLYYGKILQVDSVSLESEIETESYQLFAKFDDVTDDNIQLSSTLITSSYFKHSKKSDELAQQNQEKATDRETNEKLAATLKKHATLNKSLKKAPIEPKTKNKRKRKEVVIDTSLLSNKKAKNVKKTKGKQHTKDSSDSEVETNDLGDMLKAVPSVYDIFNEINIDMNFSNNYGYQDSNDNLCENQTDNEGHLNEKPREPKLDSETTSEKETATKSCNLSNENSDPKLTEPSEPKSTIRSKLNKFKFIEKSKKPEETEVAKLKLDTKTKSVESADSNTSSKKLSVPSSQISIFETSDCDIELDL